VRAAASAAVGCQSNDASPVSLDGESVLPNQRDRCIKVSSVNALVVGAGGLRYVPAIRRRSLQVWICFGADRDEHSSSDWADDVAGYGGRMGGPLLRVLPRPGLAEVHLRDVVWVPNDCWKERFVASGSTNRRLSGVAMLQLMLAAWAGLAFVYFIWPGTPAFIWVRP